MAKILTHKRKKRLAAGGNYDYNTYQNAYSDFASFQAKQQNARGMENLGYKALDMAVPGAGAALQFTSGVGDMIFSGDEYGVEKNNLGAFVHGTLNPLDSINSSVQSFKEGRIGEGLLTAIPGVGSGFAGIAQRRRKRDAANKVKEAQAAQDAERERQRKELIFKRDKANLSVYDTFGSEGSDQYYAFGGQSNATGAPNQIQRIAPGVSKAIGATHENGGIPLDGDTEVEDQEVMTDDGKVISNRIADPNGADSLAQTAEQIANTPRYKRLRRKLDKQAEPFHKQMAKEQKRTVKDRFGSNTIERNLEKLNSKIEAIEAHDPIKQIFELQEQMKQSGQVATGQETVNSDNTQGQMRYGGKIPDPNGDGRALVNSSQARNGTIQYDPDGRALVNKQLFARFGGLVTGSGDGRALVNKELHMRYGGRMKRRAAMGIDVGGADAGGAGAAAGGGGGLGQAGDIIGQLAPYMTYFMDNITNAKLIKRTPKVPKPLLYDAYELDTNFNINPQLAEVRKGRRQAYKQIGDSSNNSNITRANKAAVLADSLDHSSALYGQKENVETGLRNQNQANKQGVSNNNVDTQNQYNLLEMQREADILSKTSANAANLQGDFQSIITDQNKRAYDESALMTMAAAYKDSGVAGDLLDMPYFKKALRNNPRLKNKYKTILKDRPQDLEYLNSIG